METADLRHAGKNAFVDASADLVHPITQIMNQSPSLRILLLTPTVPYPPNWGFGIRVYHFLLELSRLHRVSLVCYAQAGDEDKVAELEKICYSVHTVRPELADKVDKRTAQLLSLMSARSFQSASLHTTAMERLLEHLLSQETFDIAQIESSQLSSYNFGKEPALIVDEHNLEYELLYRMYQTERAPLRKLYNFLEYKKFRREETTCWHRADACVLTSERERIVLNQRFPDKPAMVAPNGVDINYFRPSVEPVDGDSLVYTGLIGYRPNTDAVIFFANEVLPHIVKVRPKTVFSIVGMGAGNDVYRLAGPNVVVTGEVPDVRPYVHKAGVFVVPLRMGSGTRLKVLEGLAMGKAMVSTHLGCEGIDVEAGTHLLVEDDPIPFATAVLRLMEKRDEATRLGMAGRRLVEQKYSWASIVQSLEQFQLEAIQKKRTGNAAKGQSVRVS